MRKVWYHQIWIQNYLHIFYCVRVWRGVWPITLPWLYAPSVKNKTKTLVCTQAKWKWKVLFQCARRHILAAAPASAWISGAWSKGDLKEIPVTSRLPLHRSYSAPPPPSPPCRHCGSASWGGLAYSRLLVPSLAAAALVALGARQSRRP